MVDRPQADVPRCISDALRLAEKAPADALDTVRELILADIVALEKIYTNLAIDSNPSRATSFIDDMLAGKAVALNIINERKEAPPPFDGLRQQMDASGRWG